MKIIFEYSPEELEATKGTMKAFGDAGEPISALAATGMDIIAGLEDGYKDETGVMHTYAKIDENGGVFTYDLDKECYVKGMQTAALFSETFVETIEFLKAFATIMQVKRIAKNFKSMFTACSKAFCGEDPAMDEEESVRLDEDDPEVK